MGFPRQEYWTGLPFPSSGDLPDPEMETASPALAGRFFSTESPEKPDAIYIYIYVCVCVCVLYIYIYKSEFFLMTTRMDKK